MPERIQPCPPFLEKWGGCGHNFFFFPEVLDVSEFSRNEMKKE
jgi:hypothetical protein